MPTIDWLPAAERGLIDIIDYVSADDPVAAEHLADAILSSVALLAKTPEIGRQGRVPGSRELIIAGTPYIVAYAVDGAEVVILRVLHSSRRWPKTL